MSAHQSWKIRDFVLGHHPTFIIAEAGSNHAGRLDLALTLVDEAAKAGADAVKFQLFRWDDISHVGPLQDKRFELPIEWLPKLKERAHERNLAFLCTPFAPWAVEALDPYVDAWKIGSFEAMDWLLWREIEKRQKKRLILVSMGRIHDRFFKSFILRGKHVWGIVPLHCTSHYPTPYGLLFFGRIEKLAQSCRYWGYSSHTEDYVDVLAAVALGARVIEKHIRLDNERQGETPDSGDHALDPLDFEAMVHDIRQADLLRYRRQWVLPPVAYGRKEHGV